MKDAAPQTLVTQDKLKFEPAMLEQEANRCVMCGMCAPHCPTYTLTQDENESPRGRISMISGILKGNLTISAEVEKHLDNCLGCRSCERVCPSGVNYERLISGIKIVMEEQRSRTLLSRAGKNLGLSLAGKNQSVTKGIAHVLRFYQKSGLKKLTQVSGLQHLTGTQYLNNLIPNIPAQAPIQPFYPAHVTEKGQVALFTGCISSLVDRNTLMASIRVLNRCGYSVHVPEEQTCCGALNLHNGKAAAYRVSAQQNLAAFSKSKKISAIVYTSSACGQTLKEYKQFVNFSTAEEASLNRFNHRVMELSSFLVKSGALNGLSFQPFSKKVALHQPCSARLDAGHYAAQKELLSHIPSLRLIEVSNQSNCCGAGGTHVLTHPEMATSLRDQTLEQLLKEQPAMIISTNIGCALHLGSGLRSSKPAIDVIHPISLINKQLG